MEMIRVMRNEYINSLFTKIILVFLGVISSVFINRYLGPTLKGEYAYLLNIINVIVLILNLGIYQSYPYFKRKYGDEMRSEYFSVVILQFILYMIIASITSIAISKIEYTIIFTLAPLMILTNQLNFIALVENVNIRNRLSIGNQLLYVIMLIILFVFSSQSLIYIFSALYIKDIVIIFRIINKYKLSISFSSLNKNLIISILKFGVFPMLSALLITVNYNIDIIILRLFVSFKEIGYYSVGVALANQVWLIPDAFKDVLFSKTAKSDAIDDIKMSIKINLYVSLLVIFGVTMFGKLLLTVLYGSEFLPAYSVTVIIFTGLVPMIFYKMIISLFNASGKQMLSFWILLLSAVINIGMNFALIPIYGIIGAAYASVLSYSLCGLLFTYIFMREYDVKVLQLLLIDRDEIQRLKRVFQRKKQ